MNLSKELIEKANEMLLLNLHIDKIENMPPLIQEIYTNLLTTYWCNIGASAVVLGFMVLFGFLISKKDENDKYCELRLKRYFIADDITSTYFIFLFLVILVTATIILINSSRVFHLISSPIIYLIEYL